MKKRILFFTLFTVLSLPSYAQRTAEGMQFIDATASYTFSSFGGSVDWGMYFRNFYVTAGANVAARAKTLSSDEMKFQVPYLHYTATAAYMYRLYGTMSRWFTLDAGGGVLLGAESIDPCHQVPEGVVLTNSGTSFLYGIDIRFEMEFYFTRTFGMVLDGRLPFTFGSRCNWFNYEVGTGFRFNF